MGEPVSNSNPLGLAELIDLEAQLLADRQADAGELRLRDQELIEALAAEGGDKPPRHALFRRWLDQIRGSAPSMGERVVAHYRLAGIVLALIAFVAGSGTARTLLHYDGRDPVNVMGFLAVFVLGQLCLMALSLFLLLPGAVLGRLPGIGVVQSLLRDLGYRRTGFGKLQQKVRGLGPSQLNQAGARVARWSAIYGGVERWALSALTQRAAVFFNMGALAMCFYLIAVSALAFSWSTTFDVNATTMARFFQTLALPWFWLPGAVPSEELVEASRYFPGGTYDPTVLKDWWPFLIAALVTYGLIPRILLAWFASRQEVSTRRRLPLDHADCDTAYDRLTAGYEGWHSGPAHRFGDVGHAGDGVGVADSSVLGDYSGASCTVIIWGGMPVENGQAKGFVREALGWNAEAVVVAGNGGTDTAASLKPAASSGSKDPVVILAESWEAPAKNLERFLSTIRGSLGAERMIVVLLVGGDEGARKSPTGLDMEMWRNRLDAIADPYLRLEAWKAS